MTFTPFGSGRMKLVIVVVSNRDLDDLEYALRRRGHQATVIDESGALGRTGNATLVIGVQEAWLFDLMGIIEETCPRGCDWSVPRHCWRIPPPRFCFAPAGRAARRRGRLHFEC